MHIVDHTRAYTCVRVLSRFNRVQLFAILQMLAGQAPLSDSPGKNTGVGCHSPSPGDLPDPGIKYPSLMSPVFAGRFFTTRKTWEAHVRVCMWEAQLVKNPPAMQGTWV